jgi:hypothetical protein
VLVFTGTIRSEGENQMTTSQAIGLLVVFILVLGVGAFGAMIAMKPGLTPEEQNKLIHGESAQAKN